MLRYSGAVINERHVGGNGDLNNTKFRTYSGLLVIQNFFSNVIFYSIISSLFMVSRGLNYTEIFAMESILAVVLLVVDIPTSALADRYDRRVVIVFGHFVTLVSTAIFAISHGFWSFALSFALSGMGIAVLSGSNTAYIYDLYKSIGSEDDSTRVYSWISMAENCATLLSFIVGSWLATYGYTYTIYATLAANAIGLLVILFLPAQRIRPSGENTEGLQDASRRSIFIASVRVIISSPTLVFFALAGPAVWVIVNGFNYLNQPLFLRAHIHVQYFGWIMAVGALCAMLVAPFADKLQNKLGVIGSVLVSALFIAATLVSMAYTNDPIIIIGLIAILNISNSLRSPILSSAVNSMVPSEVRATVLSILSGIGTAVTIILNPVIGYLANHSVTIGLLSSGVFVLVLTFGYVPTLLRFKRLRKIEDQSIEQATS